MQDISTMLTSLKRPKLLVRAAQHGMVDYRRGTHLPRILGGSPPTATGAILMQLMEKEQAMNVMRKEVDASYSPRRHTEVLIALLSEAQAFLTARKTAPVLRSV